MAEHIEMTTWPKHKTIFYKVTSSAFSFEVKGPGNALIGLFSTLKKSCEYLIHLDYNSYTHITSSSNQRVTRRGERTPNLMSDTEYRRFWISWYGGWVALGSNNENVPIISIASLKNNIKYIAFGTCDDRNVLNWRFDSPPLFKQPKLKPISGGTVQWVEADTQLPDDALIGGYENEFLYIIRAPHRGSLTPGKFVPSLGLGFIPWGGSSNEKSEFEVLCGHDCSWVPSNSDRIPVDAIECGFSEDRLERLYVGRVRHMGHLIPGKVQLSHKVCYIAFEEREISAKEYEVLVCPNANPYSIKRVFAPPPFGDMNIPNAINEEYGNEYEVDDDDDDDEDDDNYFNAELEEEDFE
ncbi:hypothetical protein K1T71_002065 [Dendrolimus kikuchii]|uniref:Uncharacterized protein n=1 Tax=Dendrolimus kikuchii TaxID=765133 RepID=A0ACC1DFP3_9NEOP|nr:hypothetical protein K1T71_002065 [Dendrolimus kikuchii]